MDERKVPTSSILPMAYELQKRFMAVINNNPKIEEFYQQQVKPFLEQNESYISLEKIEAQFGEKTKSLKETKGIEDDIFEGYGYVLILYKFLVSFKFLQTKQEIDSPPAPLSPLRVRLPELLPSSVKLEIHSPPTPLSPLLLSKIQSPVSPVSPINQGVYSPLSSPEIQSPVSPRSSEIKLSKEFTKLQLSSAQRYLDSYKLNFEKWKSTPFSFDEAKWKRDANDLNFTTGSFNRTLKELVSPTVVEEKKLVSNDKIEDLLLAEKEFFVFLNKVEEMKFTYERITEQHKSFMQARDVVIASLEKEDDLYCGELIKTRIRLDFTPDESAEFKKTGEFKIIIYNYKKKKYEYDQEKIKVEALNEKIDELKKKLGSLDKSFSKGNILGKLLMRNRIFSLLREFKDIWEVIFNESQITSRRAITRIDQSSDELNEQYNTKIKKLKRICMRGIRAEVNLLQADAISVRKEKRAKYIEELKSQPVIISIEDISSLYKSQEEREQQLDNRWRLEVKSIIENYQTKFESIQASITESDKRDKIIRTIETLEELQETIEERRSTLLGKNEYAPARKEKIVQFLNPLLDLMQKIVQFNQNLNALWIKKQITSYETRYKFLCDLEFNQKIPYMEQLLKEIKIFQSDHPSLEEYAAKQLEKVIKKLGLQLSHDNQRKQLNKNKTKIYREELVQKMTADPGAGARVLEKAKRDVEVWTKEEEQKARLLLLNQDQDSLETKVRHIQAPLTGLASDIKEFSMPEYSCCLATLWTIFVPFFGFCIYQAWHNRKCRLAIEEWQDEMKKRGSSAGGSGNTSNAGSAPTSEELASRTIGVSQDSKFVQNYHREVSPSTPSSKKRSLLSSSGQIMQEMDHIPLSSGEYNDFKLSTDPDSRKNHNFTQRNTRGMYILKSSTSEVLQRQNDDDPTSPLSPKKSANNEHSSRSSKIGYRS